MSAHARANLWQIQWKLRRTLLTRFNFAATPLCFPVMTLAPSLTNDFIFLTCKSHSFNVSNIWSVITSAFAPRGSSMHLVARNSVLATPVSEFTYFRKIINCCKTAVGSFIRKNSKTLGPSDSFKDDFLNAFSESNEHFSHRWSGSVLKVLQFAYS